MVQAFALGLQVVADFAATEQDVPDLGGVNLRVPYDGPKSREAERRQVAGRIRMAQHAFGGEADQRLAPLAQSLAAQQVKELGGRRRLADLHVVGSAHFAT